MQDQLWTTFSAIEVHAKYPIFVLLFRSDYKILFYPGQCLVPAPTQIVFIKVVTVKKPVCSWFGAVRLVHQEESTGYMIFV